MDNPEAVALAVRRFQAGNERDTNFRVLFEQYHTTVEGFFVRRTASLENSFDLTQETFLRVYKGLDGYQWKAPFGAWLFRIAWNVLRTSASRAQTTWPWGQQVEWEESIMGTDGVGVGHDSTERPAVSALLQQEQRELLRRAIERLPTQRRRCVVFWAYHQLTYQQIAELLRISIGTVKAHMSQARQQLEVLLAEVSGGEKHD